MIYSYEDLEYEMSDALANLARPAAFGDGAAISIAASVIGLQGFWFQKQKAEVVFGISVTDPFLFLKKKLSSPGLSTTFMVEII